MFTPIAGPAAGLSFVETFFSCISGGLFSATLFYYGSSFFMKRSTERKAARAKRLKAKGKNIRDQRMFTRTNRLVIKIKQGIGIIGATWFFPLFLSVPLGTVITAKFYKHQKQTFPLIVIFLVIDCLLITGGTYLISGYFR